MRCRHYGICTKSARISPLSQQAHCLSSRFLSDDPAAKVRDCIDLLAKARVCTKVHHTSGTGVPLEAMRSEKVFKLLYLDVGLAAHVTGLNWSQLAAWSDRVLVNEGPLAEQFIRQHLLHCHGFQAKPSLHYWLRGGRSANAEVDFLLACGSQPVPIEVKAGQSGSLKSLLQYAHIHGPKWAVRYDLNPLSFQPISHGIRTPDGPAAVNVNLLSIPLYAVEETLRLLGECDAEFAV